MTTKTVAESGVSNRAEMRVVRYADLLPCRDAFIDTRSPGSDQKENFTIIGPGVSENPNQHVHIAERHGFNVGGARQPPGCLNSQHSHNTAEVFYVHTGRWRFMTGERGQDGETILGPGDLISLPTQMFRGFENVGTETGFLWAVLGGDDPGRVLWAPQVFDMAKDYGLLLLENGRLIDTRKGERAPAGLRPMPRTTQAQVDALVRADGAFMERGVVRAFAPRPMGDFTRETSAIERLLIGSPPIDWPHGFTASELRLAPGGRIPGHCLDVADVWFVQEGALRIGLGEDSLDCSTGDTITIPAAETRTILNVGAAPARLVMVRGGDAPPRITWS